jgi:hypothetical protein
MAEHQYTQQPKKTDNTSQKQTIPQKQISTSHPAAIIQRARINPKSLTHADVMQLQRTIGNRAVVRLFSEIGLIPSTSKQTSPVQRQEIPEEEEPLKCKFKNNPDQMACPSCSAATIVQRQDLEDEEKPLQGKMIETFQRQEIPEEEETLQGKLIEPIQRQEPEEEEKLQMKSVVQRQGIPEEEESLKGKMVGTIQRQESPSEGESLHTKEENNTGMPDNLKAGVESLSEMDMGNVRVHYNSSKPSEVGALAYTQGTEIHVAPGQERHLPHEAWHVVQQAQGRVKPTVQMKGVVINDDVGLEKEADVIGERAFTTGQALIAHELTHVVQNEGKERQTLANMADSKVIQGCLGGLFGKRKKGPNMPTIWKFNQFATETETVPPTEEIFLTGQMGGCVTIIAMWENTIIGRHMAGGLVTDQARDVLRRAPPNARIYVLTDPSNKDSIKDGVNRSHLDELEIFNRDPQPIIKTDSSNYKLTRSTGEVVSFN